MVHDLCAGCVLAVGLRLLVFAQLQLCCIMSFFSRDSAPRPLENREMVRGLLHQGWDASEVTDLGLSFRISKMVRGGFQKVGVAILSAPSHHLHVLNLKERGGGRERALPFVPCHSALVEA